MRKIVILLCLVLLVGGCYDYRELNDMSVVTGIGIDYKDSKYIVSLEVTKSIKDGSSNEVETVIYTGSNKILADAFLEAKNMSDKYVYMEHVNVLLLSEELCKKGIGDVIDYIISDTTINSNYYMVVTEDINKVLEIKQENDSMSNVITNTINYYLDDTKFDDLDILYSNMINKREDIAVPYISINEDKVMFKDVAYFDKDKMVDTIDNKLYLFLKLNSKNINFSKNGNTVSIYKNSIKYDIKKDKVIIKVCGDGLVKEIDSKINLESNDSYDYLNRIINKDIRENIEEFLDITLKNKSDLLGIQDKHYKMYGKDINDINYEVKTDININKNGTIYEVLYDK